MISLRLKRLKIRENAIKISRRTIQIIAFLLVNYIILEIILPINLIGFEGIVKVLPILNSPRNPLSDGSGILEYIFFSMAEGVFPFFLLAVLIIVLLLTNRIFCGWICPIGSIQDLCAAIPTKKRKFKISTHKSLLNIKYVIIIITIIIIFPLGITKNANILFYNDFKAQIGAFANQPIGFFSLSEYIFVFFPYVFENVIIPVQLGALDFGGWIIFIVYILIIILSVFYPRFYCRYICPFAAVSSAVTDFSFLKLARNPVRCVGRSECGICEEVCPKQIRILEEPFDFFTGRGECNFCLECKEKCPYDAIIIKFGNV
ncbi:MAG: 4Fe-4S binding protein [Candidatus Lokiarchaeota archaeon]|nr:4Fe-4S binding protein [Candidatus Lokiarchaeota archaeon]